MKAPSARLAMLLSIGGVLVAGSAAALVNSQVLDDQSGGAPASATAVSTSTLAVVTTTTAPATTAAATTQPATTVSTVPVTVATTAATASTAATSSTVPPSSAATTSPAGTTQATYRLGQAGTAQLDTAGGVLTIVSVTPFAGWSVDRAESDGSGVEIRLESDSGEVRFEASLVRGVVRVSLDTDDDTGSGGDDNSGPSGDDNSGPGGGDSGSGAVAADRVETAARVVGATTTADRGPDDD